MNQVEVKMNAVRQVPQVVIENIEFNGNPILRARISHPIVIDGWKINKAFVHGGTVYSAACRLMDLISEGLEGHETIEEDGRYLEIVPFSFIETYGPHLYSSS
jgi:hypothetical protein